MNRLHELTPGTCTAPETHRATVCLWSESIEEKVDFTTWLNVWKKKMTLVSPDYGCGCCIHLFDLEGPKEAIDAIPEGLLTVSEWTEHGIRHACRHRARCFWLSCVSFSPTARARHPPGAPTYRRA